MKVLLLNAGSSSLKCTLMESDNSVVFASSLADWAGPRSPWRILPGRLKAMIDAGLLVTL